MDTKIDIDKLKLLYDNILVEIKPITEVDGVITPQAYDSKTYIGKVKAVGNGRLMEGGLVHPMDIKVGDTVLFNQYTTTKFRNGSNEFFVMREEDVVAYQR